MNRVGMTVNPTYKMEQAFMGAIAVTLGAKISF